MLTSYIFSLTPFDARSSVWQTPSWDSYPACLHCLGVEVSVCGSWTSGISITWELVRQNSGSTPVYWIRNPVLNPSSRCFNKISSDSDACLPPNSDVGAGKLPSGLRHRNASNQERVGGLQNWKRARGWAIPDACFEGTESIEAGFKIHLCIDCLERVLSINNIQKNFSAAIEMSVLVRSDMVGASYMRLLVT